MSNIVYVATSLDGFIARENGDLDWLTEIPNPENSDFGFSSFLERIDGIIMGRKTFETVLGFNKWPYHKPVYILSNSLLKVPDNYEDKAEIVNGDLSEIIDSINNKGLTHLYIDGGKTIQSFLERNLIDELIITWVPIILGSGIPLFGRLTSEIRLELKSTEFFPGDLVQGTYLMKENA
jgi:dihydrofolate reductase